MKQKKNRAEARQSIRAQLLLQQVQTPQGDERMGGKKKTDPC